MFSKIDALGLAGMFEEDGSKFMFKLTNMFLAKNNDLSKENNKVYLFDRNAKGKFEKSRVNTAIEFND